MPFRLALGARKGGAGSTTTSLLLAFGLARRGRPVHMVEIVGRDVRLAFGDGAGLPFGYTAVPVAPGAESDVLALLERATRDGADVVLDLAPAALCRWDRLLARLDLLLLPVRPGARERLAAFDSGADVRRRTAATGSCMTPWLLPVGWTSVAQARRAIVGLRDAALALGGDPDLADLAIVPWTVPRLLPAARDLLFDPEALPHVPQLRPIADLLARAALRLAKDPAASCDSADALFGVVGDVDPALLRGEPGGEPERLVALGEDLARFQAGQGPTDAERAAAPLLEDWRLVPERRFVLEGRVQGHASQPDGPHRTALLFYRDGAATYARTLDGLYRLGRKAADGP